MLGPPALNSRDIQSSAVILTLFWAGFDREAGVQTETLEAKIINGSPREKVEMEERAEGMLGKEREP